MKPTLVVDKSFLQGTTTRRMHELVESHQLLMTESLFYEILSNDRDRAKCFSKFPAVENPADLVMHVGGYLRKEISLRKIAPRPSESIIRTRFQFNPRLTQPGFQLPVEALEAQAEKLAEVHIDMKALIGRAATMPTIFPAAFTGTQQERDIARSLAEAAIARDRGIPMSIYAAFRAPKGERKPPPARYIEEDWAIYRWLQVHLLFALDLAIRNLANLNNPLSASLHEKIEHDVLDAEYLIVGTLEGSFATYERKLQRWFALLCPRGTLVANDG